MEALNKYTTVDAYHEAQVSAENEIQKKLAERYGKENQVILEKYGYSDNYWCLEAYQAIHTTMCLNLTDFFTRRVPLFLAEKDHGLKYLEVIAQVFKEQLSLTDPQIQKQQADLKNYIKTELAWKSLV